VVRKNHFESFAGTTFSCWRWPKCAVSNHWPVSAFIAIELPSWPAGGAGGMPLIASSPVKYHGLPWMSANVAEQNRSKPSFPVNTYFAERTLFVRASIVSFEIRVFTPGGWPGNVAPSSWFMSTVYVPFLPCLPPWWPCLPPRWPRFLYAPRPSGMPDIWYGGVWPCGTMSLVDRIGSTTTPGAVGTRYGGFEVFTPVAAKATAAQIAAVASAASAKTRKRMDLI
jgi:hypothetical protein